MIHVLLKFCCSTMPVRTQRLAPTGAHCLLLGALLLQPFAAAADLAHDPSARKTVAGPDPRIAVGNGGAVVSAMVGSVAQQAYLKASNTGTSDEFGFAVAASGDTLVIGAPGEASSAAGVGANQADNSASDAGAVYVFVKAGDSWAQQAYLKPSNPGGNDRFGSVVAVSGDTIVVGAPGEDSDATGINGDQADFSASGAGAAYVFVRTGTTWTQQAYLKASNTAASDQFGIAVAVSGDTVVVGANREDSNATGTNGSQANNGASASGAAYVFVRSGNTWTQQAYLKASNTGGSDEFGSAVAVDGDTLAIGATGEASSATGVNGDQANDAASDAGAVYVFVRSGTAWTQQAYLKASNTGSGDWFGSALAMSGDTLLVGAVRENSGATGVDGNQADNLANDAGAAYVFVRNGTAWTQQAYLKASNTRAGDRFGIAVSVSGDTAVVGADGEDSSATGVDGSQGGNALSTSGAAYVFSRSGTAWTQQAYLKASNTGSSDRFGGSVAIAGDTVVVGADGEDGGSTGVDGDQGDESVFGAGAAYVFAGVAPTTYHSVVYKHSGKCQDVRGADSSWAAEVIQWPCHGGNNQKLQLVDKGNGYYSLVYKHSGLCTDVFGAGTEAGQKVIQWPCHGGDNQLFSLEDKGGGYFSFRYKHSGQCIDVFGGGTADGANVIQWPCHGGDNQLFQFAD